MKKCPLTPREISFIIIIRGRGEGEWGEDPFMRIECVHSNYAPMNNLPGIADYATVR